ncbi:MAG: hypothetical protein ACI81I_000297, partial [Arcobacteraceae bacterium]
LRDINGSAVGDTAYNLNQYLKHCMIESGNKVSNRNKYLLERPTKPFPEMFDPANFEGNLGAVLVSFDDNEDARGTLVEDESCASLYTVYVSAVSNDIESGMKELLEQRFPGINADDASLNEAYRDQIGDTAQIIGNIGKAMATLATTRALEKALSTEGIGVNGITIATELSIESTIASLRTEGPAKYEWITRVLPDAITIILGILIGAFPLMIIVMSFLGKDATQGILNYFMGYLAINFNLVSLALVSNIISYYTAQHAQEAIVSYAGMPFGLTQVTDFMMQQADMAGFAGIIGAASIFAVTPLIFYGETKGFSAAMSAVTGAYRGNVPADAQKELADYDAQMELDKRAREDMATTSNGMNEAQASAWLSSEGFSRPNSMSAVEAYNNMMKNYGQIGSADASSILHHGNMDNFNAQNYMRGSGAQTMQSTAKTAGLGNSVDEGVVDMAEIASVSIQDGEALGSSISKTAELRSQSDSYNPIDVGAGQAIAQYGKDMGSAALSKLDENASATVANATNAVATQVGGGQGLLKTGAFHDDGTLNNASDVLKDVMSGAAMQSAGKVMNLKGMGDSIDGSIESDGFKDYMNGSEFQGRTNANKTIADGEEWDSLGSDDNDPDKVALMKKVKENEVAQTFGGIKSTNANIMAQGGVDDFVATQVAASSLKGKSDKEVLDNQLRQGGALKGLDDSAKNIADATSKLAEVAGTLSGAKTASDITTIGSFDSPDDYIQAHARDALDNATGAKVRSDISNNQDIKDNIIENEKEAYGRRSKEALAQYVKEGKEMGFLDKDGKANSEANAWVEGRATLNASGMNKNEQGFIGGARMTSVYSPVSGEGMADTTSVKTTKAGFDTSVNKYNPENLVEADSRERAEHALDWKKTAAKIIGSGGQKAVDLNNYFKENGIDLGISDESARDGGNATALGATAILAGVTANQASKLFTKDGNSVGGKIQSKGADLRKILFGSTENETPSKTKNDKPNNSNNPSHDKSPNLNSDTSIPQENKTPLKNNNMQSSSLLPDNKSLAQQRMIDNEIASGKYSGNQLEVLNKHQQRVKSGQGLDKSAIMSMDKMTNGTFGSNVDAMTKMMDNNPKFVSSPLSNLNSADALVQAKAKIDAPSLAQPNKNFKKLSNAANAAKTMGEGIILGEVMSDAPKHSINEGSYNLARLQAAPNNVMSGVMTTAMSSVASTANHLDSVNPFGNPFNSISSKHLGANLSTVSAQLLNQSSDSFGNAWQNVSNLGSASHSVAGYTNAYNDNTSNINSTPQEYQSNTQDTMTNSLDNINMGTEFNQEASEGVREAVEQLTQTIYKNN